MRKMRYSNAILEATTMLMERDPHVFVIGQGVTSPWYVGNTCNELLNRFGEKRVIDTPISENCVTGCAIGSSLVGLKPILIHPRMDFMYLAFDQIINQAANWHYMFGRKMNVPITIRGIINRGGEQGAQHSQDLHSLFCHIPGLKVVCPSNAYDAKGLLIASCLDKNPVIYIDDRWLYEEISEVPEYFYSVEIGKGIVRKKGIDISIVGLGYAISEANKASVELAKNGIDAEIIDLRSAKPIDKDLIINSVQKTKKLLVVDGSWKSAGFASEIIALVAENKCINLEKHPRRLTLPDIPAPSSKILEDEYYITKSNIFTEVMNIFSK